MYHCVCHTCEEEDVMRCLDAAQEYFNEHARRQHEVKLLKLDVDRPDGAFASDGATSRRPEQPADE